VLVPVGWGVGVGGIGVGVKVGIGVRVGRGVAIWATGVLVAQANVATISAVTGTNHPLRLIFFNRENPSKTDEVFLTWHKRIYSAGKVAGTSRCKSSLNLQHRPASLSKSASHLNIYAST
jgi:hypothetical protein